MLTGVNDAVRNGSESSRRSIGNNGTRVSSRVCGGKQRERQCVHIVVVVVVVVVVKHEQEQENRLQEQAAREMDVMDRFVAILLCPHP